MNQEAEDRGLAEVVLERLEKERLPRGIDLKDKVDAGARLDHMNIAFLERVFPEPQGPPAQGWKSLRSIPRWPPG